jgi:hypothetical protein
MTPAPVFILGPERSGTNLLAWSLGQHPALSTTLSTRWLVPLLTDLDRLYAEATVDDRAQVSARSVDRARFYRSFGQAAGELLGSGIDGHRLVDPTPEHAFHVFALRWLFPDAQFIHVVRDASSVVRLLVDKEISKLFRAYHREHKAYEHWLSVVRAGLRAEQTLGSATVLRVLHRDLVAEPEKVLRRSLDFLGEEWHPGCLRPMYGIAPDVEAAEPDLDDAVAALPLREEAEALSRALLDEPAPAYPRDQDLLAECERAALHRSGPLPTSDVSTVIIRVKEAMEAVMPAESHALVVSRGDDRMLKLRGRSAGHFPQASDGRYLGYHPADSAEAVRHLEALRRKGAQFLVIPSTSLWWLDFYEGFRAHLSERYPVVVERDDVCVIYSLEGRLSEFTPEAPSLQDVVAGNGSGDLESGSKRR